MFMKPAKTALSAAVAVVLMVGSVGCADDGEYRFGSRWHTRFLPTRVPEMIEACQLTSEEMLMVDMYGEFTTLAAGLKCPAIHGILATYKQDYGYEPRSLVNNPALYSSPPSLHGLMYAMISVDGTSQADDWPDGRTEVLVDLVHHKLVTGWGYLKPYDPLDDSLTDLPADVEAAFLAALAPVLTWGPIEDWVDTDPGPLVISSWHITVVTADSQLYRNGGFLTDLEGNPIVRLAPPDFFDVCNAFWSLIR